jgi:hypothetical protein
MSKVYSFRLNDKNLREAQAKGAIQAWVEEGYSPRYVIAEALLSFDNRDVRQTELNEVVEQLQDLILVLDRPPILESDVAALSNSFLDTVKQSSKSEVKV